MVDLFFSALALYLSVFHHAPPHHFMDDFDGEVIPIEVKIDMLSDAVINRVEIT